MSNIKYKKKDNTAIWIIGLILLMALYYAGIKAGRDSVGGGNYDSGLWVEIER